MVLSWLTESSSCIRSSLSFVDREVVFLMCDETRLDIYVHNLRADSMLSSAEARPSRDSPARSTNLLCCGSEPKLVG